MPQRKKKDRCHAISALFKNTACTPLVYASRPKEPLNVWNGTNNYWWVAKKQLRKQQPYGDSLSVTYVGMVITVMMTLAGFIHCLISLSFLLLG